MQVKLLEFVFIPSSVGIQVFQSFIESFDRKLATALRKYQIEENMGVPVEKLLIYEDSSVNVSHKKFVD